MKKLILLPDGSAISSELIHAVTYVNKKGVLCRDVNSNPICYIKEADLETGNRIRDLLIKVAEAGNSADQPDWSFIQKAAA